MSSAWIDGQSAQHNYTIDFTTPEPVAENGEFIFEFNNFGDYEETHYAGNEYDGKAIKVFRDSRVRVGCGFWHTSPCDWYWSEESVETSLISVTFFSEEENPTWFLF